MTRISALLEAIQTIKRSGSSVLRALNDTAPVNRLPDDLLGRIFSHTSLAGRHFGGQVCHRWRSIFANITQCSFDTELCYSDSDRFVRASAVLAKFANVPVPLALFVDKHCSSLSGLLRRHMYHLRKLEISLIPVPAQGDDPQARLALVLALETPAMMLEELDLWRVRDSDDAYLSDNLLAGMAPRLRSLSLHGFALRDAIYPALQGLRTLCLSQREVNLVHILSYYPQLQQVHVDAASLASGSGTCIAPNLELLHVPGTSQAVSTICAQLDLARPLSVWTQCKEDQLLECVLANVPQKDVRGLQILFQDGYMREACVLSYSSGLTWVVEHWQSIADTAICNAELMANITELAIHELAWPRKPVELPPALSLTRLELILHRVWLSYDDDDNSLVGVFSDDNDSLCTLLCPRLENLAILSPRRPALAVDVFDILGLIDRRLCFTAEQLPCLTLRNVSLYDPALGSGMALLTSRVRRVEYSGFKWQDVPYIHRKERPLSWVYSMMT